MIRRRLAAVVVALGVGGCFADVRITRLRAELADDVRHGREAEASVVEARIIDAASGTFGETAPETVRVRTDLAESWAQWQRTDRAMAVADSTLSILERRYGPGDEKLVPVLVSLAWIHFSARRWHDAERVLDRTAGLCHAAAARNTPPADPFGECRIGPGRRLPAYYLAVGAYRKWFDAYVATELSALDSDDRAGGISMLTVLGRGFAENGEYPEARWYLERCLQEFRPGYPTPVRADPKVWGTPGGEVELVVIDGAHSFHSQSPRCLEDLIEVERDIGNFDEADRLSALQQRLWASGPDLEQQLVERVRLADDAWHDEFLTSSRLNDLAFYYAGKGRNEDARRAYQDAVTRIDRAVARDGVFAGNYPAYLHIDELLGLGAASERSARLTDAEAAYRRAAEISERELHPRHAWRLEGSRRLARTLACAGRSDEAERQWDRYLATAAQIRGVDHADFACGLDGLADTLEDSGRHREATAARDRAEGIRTAYRDRVESVRDLALPASLNSPPSPAN